MDEDKKSRTESAVPQPGATKQLSEDERRALELSDEAEHTDGEQRENATQKAEDLAG